MRKQFITTVETLLEKDKNLALLLGDIGVFGFRNAFAKFPERVYNIGILEQATISLAAGMSMSGLIPIVHTITPFLVERAYEQLKDDFGYQKLGGNFVSVGASYDYAALGCTHHCPGDVGVLKNIPGMQIVVPGTLAEFDSLFNQAYNNGKPTYYRLSEISNKTNFPVEFGQAVVVKKGKLATVVAVGTMLDAVLEAAKDLDVTILYYSTVSPFDSATLKDNCESGKVVLCEPFYSGTLAYDVLTALNPQPVLLECIGVPHEFLTNYGHAEEHNLAIGLTPESIKNKIEKIISL